MRLRKIQFSVCLAHGARIRRIWEAGFGFTDWGHW